MYATQWKAYIWHLIAMRVAADLQITRKSCIQRFLEKRHEGIHGNNPYLPPPQKLGLSGQHIGNNWRQEMEVSTVCQPKTQAHLKQLKVPRNWNLSFFAFYMYCGYQKSLGTSHFCHFACIVAIKNRWNGVHDFLKLIFLSHESSACKVHDSWLIWMEYR